MDTPESCIVDTNPPVFAGIASVTPNVNGSFLLNFIAGSSPNKNPLRYALYCALGTVNAATLFQSENITSYIAERASDTPTLVTTPVIWSTLQNYTANGSELTATPVAGWDCFARSNQTFDGDVVLEVEFGVNLIGSMIGLSDVYNPANPTPGGTIRYHLHFFNGLMEVYAYEYGVAPPNGTTSYAPGDKVSIERVGDTVYAKKNGVTFFTFPTSAAGLDLFPVSTSYVGGDVAIISAEIKQLVTPLIGRVWTLGDLQTYIVNGLTYTFGVRAIDALGYNDSNVVVLTAAATGSGNLPQVYQDVATSLTDDVEILEQLIDEISAGQCEINGQIDSSEVNGVIENTELTGIIEE